MTICCISPLIVVFDCVNFINSILIFVLWFLSAKPISMIVCSDFVEKRFSNVRYNSLTLLWSVKVCKVCFRGRMIYDINLKLVLTISCVY